MVIGYMSCMRPLLCCMEFDSGQLDPQLSVVTCHAWTRYLTFLLSIWGNTIFSLTIDCFPLKSHQPDTDGSTMAHGKDADPSRRASTVRLVISIPFLCSPISPVPRPPQIQFVFLFPPADQVDSMCHDLPEVRHSHNTHNTASLPRSSPNLDRTFSSLHSTYCSYQFPPYPLFVPLSDAAELSILSSRSKIGVLIADDNDGHGGEMIERILY